MHGGQDKGKVAQDPNVIHHSPSVLTLVDGVLKRLLRVRQMLYAFTTFAICRDFEPCRVEDFRWQRSHVRGETRGRSSVESPSNNPHRRHTNSRDGLLTES